MYLIPDLAAHMGKGLTGDTAVLRRPMKYNKFMGVLRALAMAPPLQLPQEEAHKLTS